MRKKLVIEFESHRTMSTAKKTYFQLAKEAIVALKERGGSSSQAIKAFIIKNNPGITFAQVTYQYLMLLY
jgi:hypothetical protein